MDTKKNPMPDSKGVIDPEDQVLAAMIETFLASLEARFSLDGQGDPNPISFAVVAARVPREDAPEDADFNSQLLVYSNMCADHLESMLTETIEFTQDNHHRRIEVHKH